MRLALCLAPVLAGSACAGPTLRPETAVGTGAISREAGGLQVSVEAEAWHARPRKLPDYVLPFLIRLKNGGAGPVVIARNDFLVLDDANRQFLPLPPAEIVTLLGATRPLGSRSLPQSVLPAPPPVGPFSAPNWESPWDNTEPTRATSSQRPWQKGPFRLGRRPRALSTFPTLRPASSLCVPC
jgi:hypothetical protein